MTLPDSNPSNRQDAETIRAALRHPTPWGEGDERCPGCRAEAALDRLVARLEAARELAAAVKNFAENAPDEWDGGDLGYEVGGLWTMADELLA